MANIFDAIDKAMAICWDERYGYNWGGHCASFTDGCDCGGLIFHCLNAVGFPGIPDTSPGVHNMYPYLLNAGFTEVPYNRNTFVPKDGDIITMYNPNVSPHLGHAFFYTEKVRAYTDYTAVSNNIGIVNHVKVEASSDRGHSAPGDSTNGANGAYWEVWVHAYYNLIDHSSYPNDNMVRVFRIDGAHRMPKFLFFSFDEHKKHPLPLPPILLE